MDIRVMLDPISLQRHHAFFTLDKRSTMEYTLACPKVGGALPAASFGHFAKMLMAPAVFCVAQGPEGCLPLPGSHSETRLMTPTKMRPHKPMLAGWTREISSLFLSSKQINRSSCILQLFIDTA